MRLECYLEVATQKFVEVSGRAVEDNFVHPECLFATRDGEIRVPSGGDHATAISEVPAHACESHLLLEV
jgi:hypothetical protein